MNFHGFGDESDLERLLSGIAFDISNNCRFNFPLIVSYRDGCDIDSIVIVEHFYNTIFLGTSVLDWNENVILNR